MLKLIIFAFDIVNSVLELKLVCNLAKILEDPMESAKVDITQLLEFFAKSSTIKNIFLGRFPIMLHSNLCLLQKLSPALRFELGECKNDYGGYFIISGKEKCIVSQEIFSNNAINLQSNIDDKYSYGASIRSVSEDASKPVRTFKIRMVKSTNVCKYGNIVVELPNVRIPIPLFIVMRALGVISDKEIIEYCLLDLDKYKSYMELLIPSIYDGSNYYNQKSCLEFIGKFTKGETTNNAIEILTDYLLPHIGDMNFKNKAYFIGHMVKQILLMCKNEVAPTDRDGFKYKRVELPGTLLYNLFREYYLLQKKNIFQKIDKEYYFKTNQYENDDFINIIELLS